MNTEVLYSVSWRDQWGQPWVLDAYDEALIRRISIDLAEQGRKVDPLVGPMSVDLTPEIVAAMESGQVRMFARLAADRAAQIVKERLAHKQEKLDDCANCAAMFEATPTKEMVG